MNYSQLEEEGKKSIVRSALKKIGEKSSDAVCNIFIQFRTQFPGVSLPAEVREEYPEDMAISLSDSFWNLCAENDYFSVELLFDDEKKTVKVPFDALMIFSDIDAKFNIEFDWENAPVPLQGDNIILFEDIQHAFSAS